MPGPNGTQRMPTEALKDRVDFLYSRDNISSATDEPQLVMVWEAMKKDPYMPTIELSDVLIGLSFPGLEVDNKYVTEKIVCERVEVIREKAVIHAQVDKILNYGGDRRERYGYWLKYWALSTTIFEIHNMCLVLRKKASVESRAILLSSLVSACLQVNRLMQLGRVTDDDENCSEEVSQGMERLSELLEAGHQNYEEKSCQVAQE